VLCRCEEVNEDCSKETRFACVKCNKTFAQKSYIKEHMKIHTGTVIALEKRENYVSLELIEWENRLLRAMVNPLELVTH
jgi:uncharacterized Zn-finger protein